MDIDLSGIVSELLAEAAAELKMFFSNLVKNERMKESGEYSDNPEEAAQMQAEIDATDVEFTVSGESIACEIVTSGSNYDKVSTEGKGISYSGGQGGMITLPNNEQVPSEVRPRLWGQPVPNSEEPPSMWKENAVQLIKSLLPGQLVDFIKSRAPSKLGPVLGQAVASMLTGGVA